MSDKTVLVVDDVKENIDVLVELLSSRYGVKAAPSGAIALKIARKTVPDLILLDVVMPEMDGFEVCAQLKEDPQTSGIPVVFVTSNENPEEVARGTALGAVDYLFKPVDPERLNEVCRKVLED